MTTGYRLLRTLSLFLLLLVSPLDSGSAHEGLPLVVSVEEKTPDLFLIRLVVPGTVPDFAYPKLSLAPACRPVEQDTEGLPPAQGSLQRCPEGIAEAEIRLSFPGPKPALPTLVRVQWLSGETRSLVAPPGETHVTIPSPESRARVFRQYGALGVRHILDGVDHLLFLLCLLLIGRTPRRILLIVTGFTLGHATTITLVALGEADLPRPPVEAAIALSVMYLAAELLRGPSKTLTWRYPSAVSAFFGLLHGLGFASALADIGLPQTEVPMALVSFNLGIEVGQLFVVLGCALLWRLLSDPVWPRLLRRRIHPAQYVPTAAAYAVGPIAAFWLVERTIGLAR